MNRRIQSALLILFSFSYSFCVGQDGIINKEFIDETESPKYNWDDPAAGNLVLNSRFGDLTSNEIEGLKAFVLNYPLPTHNGMNYYFRNRSYTYMMEWLYEKDSDIALLNRAINVARTCIAYRNDNICSIDTGYTCYAIDYSRTIAPVWPNYKKDVEIHDGVDCLDPGAGSFAGVPVITVPIRMIANNLEIWNQQFEGETYRDIASELIDEALLTVDYTYETMVGSDNLIRYSNLVNRTDWHGYVFIYNRVFPIISGTIPLIEAFETFNINADKIAKIDSVNNAMMDFFIGDITFYTTNGNEVLYFPYGDVAQNVNNRPAEDLLHGSLDSRDLQYIYKSKRYCFNEKHVQALANTIVEVVYQGNGKFTDNIDGTGGATKGSLISFDGYIWLASYRAELHEFIIDHILDNNMAIKNKVYDAVSLFEILKLKESTVYSNDTKNAECKVYPNPFTSAFVINLENGGYEKAELFDVSGRLIQFKELKNQNTVVFNPSYKIAPAGLYILKLHGDNGKTIKLIRN